MFYFHPYLGKIPILTKIFQMGWNHQPANLWSLWILSCPSKVYLHVVRTYQPLNCLSMQPVQHGGTGHGRIGMVLMMVFLGMWMIYSLVSWQVQLAHVPICCFFTTSERKKQSWGWCIYNILHMWVWYFAFISRSVCVYLYTHIMVIDMHPLSSPTV